MQVNQQGEQIVDEWISVHDLDDDELRTVLSLLLDRNNLSVRRTNATKHGGAVLQLQETPT